MPQLSGARAPGRRRSRWRSHGARWARVLGILIGSPFALGASPCSAQPKATNECVAAYQQAQVSRQDGDLLKAQRELVSCAGASCPDAMQVDCNHWLEEVQSALPSVVFHVLTPSGADITDARVELDHQPEQALDGRAIALNPGAHQVTVRAPHFTPVTLQLQFVEGQKLRQESLTLQPIVSSAAAADSSPPGPGPRSTPTRRRLTAVQWLGAGSAVVGGVGLTYFGLKARAGESDLDGCSPTCSKSAVADVKRNYLAANLSLGLGLVGLAVGTLQYLAQGSFTASNTVAKHGATAAAGTLQLELGPSFSGLSGSF